MPTFESVKKLIDPQYQLFIGGEWMDAASGKTFDVICPCNGEKLATCANADASDVDKAVKAAWKAFPAWSKISQLERAKILNDIADRLEQPEISEKILWADTLEASKAFMPMDVSNFRYCAGLAATTEGIANTTVDYRVNMVCNEPIGVVGLISAWNGPFGMACMKIPPALAAGNCIIYRPSSHTPIGTLMLAQAISDLLPPGVLNVVTGDSATCGQAMLDHPGIHKLSFTGSTEVGISVAAAAAQKLIPATLELGGKSANIFLDDCDFDLAMQGFYTAIFMMNGQVCAAGSRVLVQEDIYDKFVSAAVKIANNIKLGPVWEDGIQMSSLIYEKQMQKVLDYIDIGKKEGGKILCGGKRATGGALDKGFYIEPTIMEGNNSMRIAQEEIFGPVALIIPFKTDEEAIAIANDSTYGLAGGVWTKSMNRALHIARSVRTGTMWVNTYNLVAPGYPFGGYKRSGIGREMHRMTLDHFSHKKSIIINTNEQSLF